MLTVVDRRRTWHGSDTPSSLSLPWGSRETMHGRSREPPFPSDDRIPSSELAEKRSAKQHDHFGPVAFRSKMSMLPFELVQTRFHLVGFSRTSADVNR
jgi:hypothetical protein